MTPVFTSPYSSKISDYATSLDTRFQLIVNPTDIGINSRQVRLKMYISGNGIEAQTSDFGTGLNPIFINGGEIQTLTNVDLAGLFRLENLQGLSNVQYANPLPEGNYNVCFEMFDFVTNQRISQKSCANIYLILNDPPILNTPARNEQIVVSDFPNIQFTWTPRQINATNVSYRFELKLLQDPTIDPQFGFAISQTVLDETQFGTTLIYNLSKPLLIPGKRYAWRVRAISTGGLSENSICKNDGYSEIFWFTYASNCPVPTFVFSEIQGSKTVKITWQGSAENTKYHVQYRKKSTQGLGFEWFSTYTLNTQTTINDLDVATDYEFRVGATCEPSGDPTVPYTYSGINNFSTPAAGATTTSAYSCGLNPAVNITNTALLPNLIESETFFANDFPVKVLEVTGSNGIYSGNGFIIVPYLAETRIKVSFENISINTDYKLIEGQVLTTYNPSWGNNNANTTNTNNNNEPTTTEQNVNFPISDSNSIQVNTQQGTITIIGTNGESITVNINSQYDTTTIIDSNGVGYVINNSTGAVTTSSQLQEVVTSVEQNQATIKFKIKETIFLHKEDFATMIHGKDIYIEILKKETAGTIDLSTLQFKLEDKVVMATKVGDKYFIKIKADALTLKTRKSTLKVLTVDGRDLAKLSIIKYSAPIVKFNKPDGYNGEFLFDNGFKLHDVLKDSIYYKKIIVGKNRENYFAPVIGLKKNQSVDIKIDLKDFEDIAKKDPNFKLVFRPTVDDKLVLNNMPFLEVNAENLKIMTSLNITANSFINERQLQSINIEVYVKETNEKVGLIEYFCAKPVKKTIHLIYTKFLDEITYPLTLANNELQNYLNSNSHNQFFIEYIVNRENFTVDQNRISFLNNKVTSTDLFYGLKLKKFPTIQMFDDVPAYNNSVDYYFVTDIEKIKTTNDDGTPGSFLGGAHLRGSNGGIHLKTTSTIGETQIELAAHEFGHWIGLPHTFEEKNSTGVIIPKPAPFITIHNNHGVSRDNFMDYNVKRKTSFRLQLLNTNRTSNP